MVEVWYGLVDLLALDVDAIVCGANTGLVMGSGTAGAIWRRGGASIQDECDRLGTRPLGDVVVTSAGGLPARHVFHAVTMGYEHPDVGGLFAGVTRRCLELAGQLDLRSLAFMALSGGRMKLPPDLICESMVGAVARWSPGGTSLESVGFALRDRRFVAVFESRVPALIGVNPELVLTDRMPPVVEATAVRPRLRGPRGRLP